jgi:lactoylglutathione lyase
MARAVEFYSLLGLRFTQHRHGNGPEHFAAELGSSVFELYPLAPNVASTLGTRIGFRIPSLEAVIAALGDYPAAVHSPPKMSPWGLRAVVADPDGHLVELIQS